MSSYDGGGFEEWVRDSIYGDVTEEQICAVIAVLEPVRAIIGQRCDDFDEDMQSWRDYRNSLWQLVPKDLDDRVTEILRPRKEGA
jgi:hypothetical protein